MLGSPGILQLGLRPWEKCFSESMVLSRGGSDFAPRCICQLSETFMVFTTGRGEERLASSGWRPRMRLNTLPCTQHSPAPPQPRISRSQMPVVPRVRNTHSQQSSIRCSELLPRVQKACAPARWVRSSLPGSDWDFPPRTPGTGSSAAHPSCPGTFSPDLPKPQAPAILPAHAPPPLAAQPPWHSTGPWPRSPGNIPDLCFGFL